jgi:DNA processing protein
MYTDTMSVQNLSNCKIYQIIRCKMIKKLDSNIYNSNKYINKLDNIYYTGNTNLLHQPKIGIVGSRRPNNYARELIRQISSQLSNAGICIVSGGAMGIDAIAHKNAGASNTIMVAGTGLDKRYPKINSKLIEDIENNGLVISQFAAGMPSLPRSFAIRNKLIVELSEVLIVAYADKNSGTSRSIEYALKSNTDIYVLPHRLGESDGTNDLLQKGLATAIYDVNKFVNKFTTKKVIEDTVTDEFLIYCRTNHTYDEAISKFGAKVFEYELGGKIEVKNGKLIAL